MNTKQPISDDELESRPTDRNPVLLEETTISAETLAGGENKVRARRKRSARGSSAPPPMSTDTNEGEGNRTADRAYRAKAEQFVAEGRVEPAAVAAAHSLEGPDAMELRAAESIAKAHSAGEDRPRAAEADPRWWNDQHQSRWERVKAALERDWLQTREDLGLRGGAELGQRASDTLSQVIGVDPVPPMLEPQPLHFDEERRALRFGFGAGTAYGERGEVPSPAARERLEADWNAMDTDLPWKRVEMIVLRGWAAGVRDLRGHEHS